MLLPPLTLHCLSTGYYSTLSRPQLSLAKLPSTCRVCFCLSSFCADFLRLIFLLLLVLSCSSPAVSPLLLAGSVSSCPPLVLKLNLSSVATANRIFFSTSYFDSYSPYLFSHVDHCFFRSSTDAHAKSLLVVSQ